MTQKIVLCQIVVGFSYTCINAQTAYSQWYPCIHDDKCFDMSSSLKRRKCSWLCIVERMGCIHSEYIQYWPIVIWLKSQPLYLHIATEILEIDQCIRVQKGRGKLCDLAMAMIIYMKKRFRVMSWTSPSIKMWKPIRRNWRMPFAR